MSTPSEAEINLWKQCYQTPAAFLKWVEKDVLPRYGHTHFSLDTCALPWNSKCKQFIGLPGTPPVEGMIGEDGLKTSWKTSGAAWCNPGFKKMKLWVPRAIEQAEEGQFSVMMSLAAHATEWALLAISRARACHLIHPRINFDKDPRLLAHEASRGKDPTGNMKESMLWIYEPGWTGPCEFVSGAPWCETEPRGKSKEQTTSAA